MLRVNQIKIPVWVNKTDLNEYVTDTLCKKLKITRERIIDFSIVKKSIDSRKKSELFFVYCIDVQIADEKKYKIKDKDIISVSKNEYKFPLRALDNIERPVIVGLGPAGLFCAYMLAKAGYKPIVFERGKSIDDRTRDVETFWETGVLNTNSNVQFGEGGAGAFSDGKLNTLVKDKNGRNREVLKILVEHGADEEILYENKPHIGTDLLVEVVKNIREDILKYGGEIYYESTVEDFIFEKEKLTHIRVNDKIISCNCLCLAIGHSARDTFEVLYKKNVPMDSKSFAVGFRVMHPQSLIDENQYGEENLRYNLPTASYKLTYQANNGRGVYSFCMCPGGYVVNSSSYEKMTVVNGMSYHSRDSKVANSAIIVSVTPADYDGDDALAGVRFQKKLEEKAYNVADGLVPIQYYGKFKKNITNQDSKYHLDFEPAIKGKYKEAELNKILPKELNETFIEGMEDFGKKIKHFNDGNVIMAGIESRTSSPVRIWRDNITGMSEFSGLYPCGEGAGYAGGITSAAMDGIFVAECMAKYINNME